MAIPVEILDPAQTARRIIPGPAYPIRVVYPGSSSFRGTIKMPLLPVVLVCDPGRDIMGGHAIPIVIAKTYLTNELKNPSFEVDSNADGLADNWVKIEAPTYTMESTIVLHGAKSQKIVTANVASEGVYQAGLVPPAGTTKAVAYVWFHRVEPGNNLQVWLRDNTAGVNRDIQGYNTAGWLTAQDAQGNTWKRVVVSSSAIVAGNNHHIHIRCQKATHVTTFYCDKAFWLWGTTTPPPCDGW